MSATRADYENSGRQAFKAGLSLLGATEKRKPGTWQYAAIVDGWQAARQDHQKALGAAGKAQAGETPPKAKIVLEKVVTDGKTVFKQRFAPTAYKLPPPLPEGHPAADAFKDWPAGAREHVRQLANELAEAETTKRQDRLMRSFNRVARRWKKERSLLAIQSHAGVLDVPEIPCRDLVN